MYKSPIDTVISDIVTEEENAVMRAVVKCGINVDKDELVKALAYDRGQYDLGYADGKMDAKAELIRCEDCKHRYTEGGMDFCKKLDSMFYHYEDQEPIDADFYCKWAERKENDTDRMDNQS